MKISQINRWKIWTPICIVFLTWISSSHANSMHSSLSTTTTTSFTPKKHRQIKDAGKLSQRRSHHLYRPSLDTVQNQEISSNEVLVRGGNTEPPMFNTQNMLGATFFIIFDIVIRRVLTAKNIAFPSMMAGCLFLFGGLLLAEFVYKGLGDAIFVLLTPGSVLLSKWLPIFFVPGLALLPLAPKFGSAAEVGKVLATVIIGFLFSLSSTGFAVLGLRKIQGIATSVSVTKTSGSSGPPPKAFPDGVYANARIGVLVFGCLSIVLTRSSSNSKLAILAQTLFMACTTISSYIGGTRLPSLITAIVHPLVISTAGTLLATSVLGSFTDRSFEDVLRTYKVGSLSIIKGGAGDFLLFLLGPSVVSMCIAMYSRKKLMKDNFLVVMAAMLISSTGGLFGTAIFVRILNIANKVLRISLLPRSVTTALAIAVSEMLHGNVAITASVVVMTGILGGTFGARICTKLGIMDPVSRGLAIGSAGQGLGVASMVNEVDAFPFAAIALVLAAVGTTVLVSIPAVQTNLLKLATGGMGIAATAAA